MATKNFTFNVFPHQYAAQTVAERDRRLAVEENNLKNTVTSHEADTKKKIKRANSPIGTIIMFICLFAPVVIGFKMCMDDGQIVPAFLSVIITFPIGAVISQIVARILDAAFVHPQQEAIRAKSQETINSISGTYGGRVEKIKAEANEQLTAYTTAFNQAAVQQAAQMVNNPAVAAVTQWIVGMYASEIEKADRSGHIQKITVLFEYRVYRDHIGTFPGDAGPDFNFEMKRFSSLRGPVEQAALARAVASAIQLEIMMRYSEDPSGTSPVVDIKHPYDETGYNHTVTQITYTAPNGNYQTARSWN